MWANGTSCHTDWYPAILRTPFERYADDFRVAQAEDGKGRVEVMLQRLCIPCVKRLMLTLAKQPRPADDHLYEYDMPSNVVALEMW